MAEIGICLRYDIQSLIFNHKTFDLYQSKIKGKAPHSICVYLGPQATCSNIATVVTPPSLRAIRRCKFGVNRMLIRGDHFPASLAAKGYFRQSFQPKLLIRQSFCIKLNLFIRAFHMVERSTAMSTAKFSTLVKCFDDLYEMSKRNDYYLPE